MNDDDDDGDDVLYHYGIQNVHDSHRILLCRSGLGLSSVCGTEAAVPRYCFVG